MKDHELESSLTRVGDTMECLVKEFMTRVETLRGQGVDDGQIRRLMEGARAMKDSGRLYMEWARFYAQEIAKVDPEAGEDDDFFDEGTLVNGVPFQ